MPGFSPTSASACAARVPEPRGRPRRPFEDADRRRRVGAALVVVVVVVR